MCCVIWRRLINGSIFGRQSRIADSRRRNQLCGEKKGKNVCGDKLCALVRVSWLAKVKKKQKRTYFFHLPTKNPRKYELEWTWEGRGSGGRVEGRIAKWTPNVRLCCHFLPTGLPLMARLPIWTCADLCRCINRPIRSLPTYAAVTSYGLDSCRLMPLYRSPD